jgi:hypothetical protein
LDSQRRTQCPHQKFRSLKRLVLPQYISYLNQTAPIFVLPCRRRTDISTHVAIPLTFLLLPAWLPCAPLQVGHIFRSCLGRGYSRNIRPRHAACTDVPRCWGNSRHPPSLPQTAFFRALASQLHSEASAVLLLLCIRLKTLIVIFGVGLVLIHAGWILVFCCVGLVLIHAGWILRCRRSR